MKCYYCGENEAEYRFFINYMGNMGDIRLCGSCMEKIHLLAAPFLQELQNHLQEQPRDQSGWQQQMPAFLRQTGFDPAAFARNQPGRGLGEDSFPLDAGDEFKQRRKLNELRAQMSLAITVEDYEKAACLRDEITQLEAGPA